MAEPAVELVGIGKSFAGQVAVESIDLAVRPGEFLTLLGPSGCGKTTTLNMIAGFMTPDRGEIRLAGRSVEREPPFRRDIGLVFQDYALFPHLTVAQNVAFGLRMRKVPKAEIGRRVGEALDLVRLGAFGERRPSQLSGGQRQRVALARAMAIRPTVLLLDEPMSNLDLKLREEMRLEVARLQRHLGITTVLVTHDQSEALAVSDRIVVLNRGGIEQIGSPVDIYEQPATRFVAGFIGTNNLLRGRALDDIASGRVGGVSIGTGRFAAFAPMGAAAGASVAVQVRPEHLQLDGTGADDGALRLTGIVAHHVYLGETTEVHVNLADGETCLVSTSRLLADRHFPLGGPVMLAAAAEHCRVFPA